MLLCEDKKTFRAAISSVRRKTKTNPSIIEKDYYVTLFLKELVKRTPYLLFKGGTSLSKCHKIIDRFSEDIDLTLDENMQSWSKRKNLKYTIVDLCQELNLKLLNQDQTRSRRDYNCYKIDYLPMFKDDGVNPLLLVETVFMVKSFPYEIKPVSSMIYDYFKSVGNEEIISKYELEPFDIHVQKLERTLVEKVFAICDYYIGNRITRNSRHIYDIYRLLSEVKLDEDLKSLAHEIRELRKDGVRCFSARDGVSINGILKETIDTEFYKNDYETITNKMLFKPLEYSEAIKSLQIIIDSGVFENI